MTTPATCSPAPRSNPSPSPPWSTTFLASAAEYGLPASTLTDNGLVYTTRLAGGRGGRNAFEHQLHTLGITQKNGSPNHPQTQGKIERFHQTLKRWLTRAAPRPHPR